MAWVAPVTAWGPTDGIADTDLERIEGNTEYLKTHVDTAEADITSLESRRVVSAMAGGSAQFSVGAGLGHNLLRFNWYLADQKKIVLDRASYGLSGSNSFRLKVEGVTGATWTSTSWNGDETPVGTIHSNTTGAAVLLAIIIWVSNTDGGSAHDLYPEDGGVFGFSVQDV